MLVHMKTTALLAAMREMCQGPWKLGSQLTSAMLLELGTMCLSILTAIGRLVHQSKDPRLVLLNLQLIEQVEQLAHFQKIALAFDAELTAAHALSLSTLDTLRKLPGRPQAELDACLAQPPQLASGRTCYNNAEELIAAWLGISFFEAQRRIDDAHLLIGRRTSSGEECAPRFEHLAELFAQGSVDRRRIAQISRQLEKLEPGDTTFDGVPAPLRARGTDGQLLEESAAQALAELGPNAARKQIGAQINQYRETHGMIIPPKLGFFIGKVIGGVHTFHLRTDASQAEVLHSMAAQSGNPRTKAGKAARKPANSRSASSDPDQPSQENDTASDQEQNRPAPPTPDWLISEQQMPDWARSETAGDNGTPAERETAAEDAAGTPNDTQTQAGPADHEAPDAAGRRLNALMAILAASATPGKQKNIVPKVLVYMWLSDLQNLAEAHGVSAHGVDIPPGELRRLLAHAGIIPLVLGSNSQPLDMGRSQRFHKGAIRTAIMARDRGCIVPDCTTPPENTEVDHYDVPWSEGGETSVWSGAGLCTSGHHQRHADQLKVVDVDGLPHVILPEHLDPEQKPRRNTYWGALQAGDCPDRTQPAESAGPTPPATDGNAGPDPDGSP